MAIPRTTVNELKNCRHCPQLEVSCDGNASECLCLRCPRNLGQCIRVRYCRETESILDFSPAQEHLAEAALQEQLDSYFKRME